MGEEATISLAVINCANSGRRRDCHRAAPDSIRVQHLQLLEIIAVIGRNPIALGSGSFSSAMD